MGFNTDWNGQRVLSNGRVVVVFKGSKVEYELDPFMVKLV